MTPERWEQIGRLYEAVSELPAHSRAAFLREACQGDDALRAEVESLLANGVAAGDFLNAGAMLDAAKGLAEDHADSLVGRNLGHYSVISLLGAGGMGEVYKARDARLGRDVAVKVLPALAARNDSARQRFQREAKAVAALSHPNIRSLYDVGEADGRVYAVMELLDGETLRARLKRGPLSSRKAMEMSAAIAEGVAAAHARGIVHRDLKPENVFITAGGHVKVLDFGLAKLADPVDPNAGTQTASGVILGTAGYMSPEQVAATDVDARSDIFSLGCVLYEMVSGRRPFERKTTAETMTAILNDEPPELESAGGDLRRIIAHCLEKQPDVRFQSAQDLAFQLRGLAGSATVEKPARALDWRLLWAGSAALLLITTVGVSLRYFRHQASSVRPVHIDIMPPAHETVTGAFALSPDSTRLAFISPTDDKPPRTRLWVHSLEVGEARLLADAGDAVGGPLVWSPDGRSIAFSTATSGLKRIGIAGGLAQTVVEPSVPRPLPMAWSRDDIILFGRDQVVMKVPAAGGAATALTALDPARNVTLYVGASFLPDGRHFLYGTASFLEGMGGVYVGSVDARPEEQSTKRLIAGPVRAVYAPSTDDPRVGHLLFNRGGALVAQGFDAGRLELTGAPIPIVDQLESSAGPIRPGAFSVSATGALAYRRQAQEPAAGMVVWLDPSGRTVTPLLEAPLNGLVNVRLSPDEQRLAVTVDGDIWVYDLRGRPPIKLTSGGRNDIPLWTPDGKRIFYSQSTRGLLSVPSDVANATPEVVWPNGHYHPHAWSPDGRELIAVLNSYGATSWDILGVPLHEKRDPTPIARTTAEEGMQGAALSPDGRWLAYTSDATGQRAIWVQPYPGPGAAVPVSPHGGVDPHWARDGRTLYYIEDTKLMAVAVESGSTFEFKPPASLFEMPGPALDFQQSYDVARDGRFITIKTVTQRTAVRPVTVILNWAANLPGANR